MWDVTADGNVLAGEFGFQAIIRECKEELGIELSKNDIIFIGSVILLIIILMNIILQTKK